MPQVQYKGESYTSRESETVLDCLERNGIIIPGSCRSGVCQSCLMKAIEGVPPERSQNGLREDLRTGGYFLSCVCVPEDDMTVERGDSAQRKTRGRVINVELLNPTVARLTVWCDPPVPYIPGQFLNIRRADGLVRSYSIASVPDLDRGLHFHVAHVPDGQMSGWIHKRLYPGYPIELLGPQGSCYYAPGKPEQPLLLVGIGTGLAPLFGILRHALHSGHTGPIHLYHGAENASGLYLVDELRDLEASHASFSYSPCTWQGEEDGVLCGSIDEIALERHADLSGWRVFLCGDPEIVRKLQRKTFLAGAQLDDIHADAFIRAPKGAPGLAKT